MNSIIEPQHSDLSDRVSFLVRKYVFLKSSSQDKYLDDKHIPDGSCALVFNFTGEVRMILDKVSQKLPPYFLTVPYIRFLTIRTSSPVDTFVVVCKASVVSRFFGITFNMRMGQSFRTIDEVIPYWLWLQLKNGDTCEKRIRIFEDYIDSVAQTKLYEPDIIDLAYERIYSSGGLLKVEELAGELQINSRTFRRKFNERVGISPKSLCRIVRVIQLFSNIIELSEMDAQDMVCQGNFFDQSHLVHDFKNITGESPKKFFGRNLEDVRAMSGY